MHACMCVVFALALSSQTLRSCPKKYMVSTNTTPATPPATNQLYPPATPQVPTSFCKAIPPATPQLLTSPCLLALSDHTITLDLPPDKTKCHGFCLPFTPIPPGHLPPDRNWCRWLGNPWCEVYWRQYWAREIVSGAASSAGRQRRLQVFIW